MAAHGTEGIASAAAAGVDTIEHCTWLTGDVYDPREDVAALIAAEGVHVCPTTSPTGGPWPGGSARSAPPCCRAACRGCATAASAW
ncbi:hypothetical protein [Sphaerisporangium sp. NPDC051011]|uniref:hypothetical protein n=1 Tax=Sphaerisporangium sp. NPDC051011 TaxID=3155792 RepID=UPI0033C1B74B